MENFRVAHKNSSTQLQIDVIKEHCATILGRVVECENLITKLKENLEEKNKELEHQQNKITELKENLEEKNKELEQQQNKIYSLIKKNHGKKFYLHTSKIYRFTIDSDISVLYITMVAGGGAGGIGFINDMIYYSGGGGGSGSALINRPILVGKGTVLKIGVGKGGDSKKNRDGEDTIVEISRVDSKKESLVVLGGRNGFPQLLDISARGSDISVSGGIGGASIDSNIFSGSKGIDGKISMPSFLAADGGKGASSAFHSGGQGGGINASEIDLLNGKNLSINLIGKNGTFGSGGGGSAPKTNLDSGKKYSGNGGSGFVIIEW